MVDRLEELLALLEDEDDEDEREDALGLRAAAIPAAPASEIETEEAAKDSGKRAADLPVEDAGALAEAGALNWMPDGKVRSVPAEGQDKVPGADGSAVDAVEDGAVGREAAEVWWDDLAAPVMGRNGSMVLRRPGAGDVEIAELAGAPGQTSAPEEMGAVMESMAAEKGLEGLYRQTVQASRPAAQNLPVEQAGRMPLAQEPGRTAALTVDELDRAVRRDSRRYDGGMTIF